MGRWLELCRLRPVFVDDRAPATGSFLAESNRQRLIGKIMPELCARCDELRRNERVFGLASFSEMKAVQRLATDPLTESWLDLLVCRRCGTQWMVHFSKGGGLQSWSLMPKLEV